MTSLRNNVLTLIAPFLLVGCSPRVATSFWKIGTPADSIRPGYTVIHAEGKTRHCYPVTQWTDTLPFLQEGVGGRPDTYHQLHHHGVAVESDRMAYRIYFDKKQTIDVYCKRTPRLELAESHWYPNDSLLAEGYGDDILRVSGTVGVGSVKYWNGTKMVHIEPVAERSQRIVKQTRTKATIEVAVTDWNPTSFPLGEAGRGNLTVQYTLRAGHRDMRCDVYANYPFENLCTGVQTIPAKGGKDTVTIILPNGVLLASWGTDWPVNDSVKYAKETVGLAVFIPKEYAGEIVHDKQNNLCLLNTLPFRVKSSARLSVQWTVIEHSGVGCHFYLTVCGATKEKQPVATTFDEWLIYLRRWAKKLR